jgi:hypothetical protein
MGCHLSTAAVRVKLIAFGTALLCAAAVRAEAQTGYWAFDIQTTEPWTTVAGATYGLGLPCCGAPTVFKDDSGEWVVSLSLPDSPLEGYGFFRARVDSLSIGVHVYERIAGALPTWSSNRVFDYRPPLSLTRNLSSGAACLPGDDRLTLREFRTASVANSNGTYPVDALSFDIESRCHEGSFAIFTQYRYNAGRSLSRVGMLTIAAPSPLLAGDRAEIRVDGEAGAAPLEYKFWRYRRSTRTWTEVQDYSLNPTYWWTPTAADVDTFSFQVWTRTRGATAAYDDYRPLGPIVVAGLAASITSLTADVPLSAQSGQTIVWTSKSRVGTAGPLQYQFWLLSHGIWSIAQPYGASASFTWTPSWGDEGPHAVQVWVRSAGSAAAYEGWKSTGLFNVVHAPLHLTTTTLFPLAPGTPVTWQAASDDGFANLEFQFWLFTHGIGWTVAQSYGSSSTWTWTPTITGTYAVQVWARQIGSSAAFEAWRSSGFLTVSTTPATLLKLTSDVSLPAHVGASVTWIAAASGGTARLQYQFWRFDSAGWIVAQAWGDSNTYTWTPGTSDAGTHAVQVWVRSSGSTAAYEAWMSSGFFTINP